MNAIATKNFLYDGLTIVVTDQAEQVILKLQAALADKDSALSTAAAAHVAAIALKDGELGTLAAEIVDLKAKVLDEAGLDALVAERASLLADVAKVADGIDTKGKTVADIRRAAVLKRLGDAGVAQLDGKSDDYVAALFDAFVAKGKVADAGNGGGPLADAIGDTLPGADSGGAPTDGGKAYEASVAAMRDAWKQPAAGTA